MTTNYLLLLVSVLFLLACQAEDVQPVTSLAQVSQAKEVPADGCKTYYFYDGGVQVNLGNVSTSSIVVGFVSGLRGTEKKKFLKSYEAYLVINSTYPTYTVSTPEILALKPGLTCLQVESLLQQLAKSDLIRYANPTFGYGGSLKLVYSTFFVLLNSKATAAQLEELCIKTNTKIVDASGADWGFYLVEADKHSAGNALEMANYFHEQRFIDAAELDAPIYPAAQ